MYSIQTILPRLLVMPKQMIQDWHQEDNTKATDGT